MSIAADRPAPTRSGSGAAEAPLVAVPAPAPARPAPLPLGRARVFWSLERHDLVRLERLLRIARIAAREPLPAALRAEDHVYVVREGLLGVLQPASGGHPVMVGLLEPGALYATLGGAPAPEGIALVPSAVSPVPVATLKALIRRYPQLGVHLAEALADQVALLRATVAAVSEVRVEDRLRARLHELADRLGTATPAGAELRLGLTHAQWARLIGASRESTTLAFASLRRQGAIAVDGRRITIPWPAPDAS